MALKLSVPRDNITGISPNGPTLASVAPDWVELSEKLQKLLGRKAELVAKIDPLQKSISASGLTRFHEQNRRSKESPRLIEASAAARALLGEKYTPAPKLPEPVGVPTPAAIGEMQKISEELAGIEEAINYLRPQLSKAWLEGSKRLWQVLGPEYRAIAGRICDALVELGRAHVDQEEFFYRHRSAAKAFLRPVHGTGTLGDPRDPYSELRRLLEWGVETGHFDSAKIPLGEWKSRPGATPFA